MYTRRWGADAGPIQGGEEAQRRELLDRVGQEVDPHPQLPHLLGLLEELHPDPGSVQHQGGAEAPDAAPRDEHPHP